MAPNSLLLIKNDSSQNLIQNSQWWAFGYYWGLQNMAALPRKLQAWNSCAYQSQKPMPLYGYKEFELLTGPLSPGALQISFSDWLSSRQGEWGCKCTISFSLEKQGWRRKALDWEHSNSSLFAVFTNKCHPIRSIHFLKPITSASNLYLQNACISIALQILEHLPIGVSQQGPLLS